MSQRRVLVTGANGFIGQAVCAEILKQDMKVRAITRLPCNFGMKVENIALGNIDHNTNWRSALLDCDAIIHLAARVHVMKEEVADPMVEFLKVNLLESVNLAEQAAANGVKRFVYVSSVKVNGEYTDSNMAFRETDTPHPQDSYALSKWEAEQSLQKISQKTGMELVIVRPPLVYGPGVKANFAKLLKLIDRGIPLPLGNIQNLRSLVYVGNLANALITCAVHSAAPGQTYLVNDGEDVSTPQLIRAIAGALNRGDRSFSVPINLMRFAAKLIGKSAAIDRLTQSLVVDSSKIWNELGWQPPYSIAQGLQATADWYRSTFDSMQT